MRSTGSQNHLMRYGDCRYRHTRRLLIRRLNPRTGAAGGAIKHITDRLVDDTRNGLTLDRQADLHREIAVALNEVLSSIHRINHPYPVLLQTILGVGRFLGEDSIVRE